MKVTQYVALLRGINVGGNNSIKMIALKACFEEMGFTDVATYIQSGNVLFTAKEQDLAPRSRRPLPGGRGQHEQLLRVQDSDAQATKALELKKSEAKDEQGA